MEAWRSIKNSLSHKSRLVTGTHPRSQVLGVVGLQIMITEGSPDSSSVVLFTLEQWISSSLWSLHIFLRGHEVC